MPRYESDYYQVLITVDNTRFDSPAQARRDVIHALKSIACNYGMAITILASLPAPLSTEHVTDLTEE